MNHRPLTPVRNKSRNPREDREGRKEEESRTSMGNFPPSHFSCAAYVTSLLIPLTWGSWTFTASERSRSMIIRSSANISGRWSYLDEIYWVMASDNETVCDRRKGSCKMLLVGISEWLWNVWDGLISDRMYIYLRCHCCGWGSSSLKEEKSKFVDGGKSLLFPPQPHDVGLFHLEYCCVLLWLSIWINLIIILLL